MRRKIWKKMLAAGCSVSLLTTAPGMTVLADQLQEDEVIVTEAEDPELMTELVDDVIDEDADELFVEEGLNEEYGYAEEVGVSSCVDNEKVGTGDFVVGDGVNATFDKTSGAVEFYSNSGMLWKKGNI